MLSLTPRHRRGAIALPVSDSPAVRPSDSRGYQGTFEDLLRGHWEDPEDLLAEELPPVLSTRTEPLYGHGRLRRGTVSQQPDPDCLSPPLSPKARGSLLAAPIAAGASTPLSPKARGSQLAGPIAAGLSPPASPRARGSQLGGHMLMGRRASWGPSTAGSTPSAAPGSPAALAAAAAAAQEAAAKEGSHTKPAEEKKVGQELRSMLEHLNVDIRTVTMSEEWEAMLALAQDMPAGRHFDSAKQKEAHTPPPVLPGLAPVDEKGEAVEAPLESGATDALDAAPRGPASRRGKKPSMGLQPGVFAPFDVRARALPAGARGLPDMGRFAHVTQARPKTSDFFPSAKQPKLPRNIPAWSAYVDHSGTAPAPEPAPPAPAVRTAPVTAASLAKSRQRPGMTWNQPRPEDMEQITKFVDERRGYAEWKRKVVECARSLDLEVNRFRAER